MASSDQESSIQEVVSRSYFQYLNDTLEGKIRLVRNEISLFDLPEWFHVYIDLETGEHLKVGEDRIITCSKKYFEANKNHPKLELITRDEMMEVIQKQIGHDKEWLKEVRAYYDKQLAEHSEYEPEVLETIKDQYLFKDSWESYEDRAKKLDDAEKTLALLKDPKTREDTLYRLHPRFTPTSDNDEDLYEEAVSLIARTQIASTSFLQHHLSIGYSKAAMLMERLKNEGVVGKANDVKKEGESDE